MNVPHLTRHLILAVLILIPSSRPLTKAPDRCTLLVYQPANHVNTIYRLIAQVRASFHPGQETFFRQLRQKNAIHSGASRRSHSHCRVTRSAHPLWLAFGTASPFHHNHSQAATAQTARTLRRLSSAVYTATFSQLFDSIQSSTHNSNRSASI